MDGSQFAMGQNTINEPCIFRSPSCCYHNVATSNDYDRFNLDKFPWESESTHLYTDKKYLEDNSFKLPTFTADNSDLRNCDALPNISEMLFNCVQNRNLELLQTLITVHHVNLNVTDMQGTTPLIMASKLGYDDVMAVLIAGGANINDHDSKMWTALHWTSVLANAIAVDRLCRCGADPHARTQGGKTALELAVLKQHTELAGYLRRFTPSRGGGGIATGPYGDYFINTNTIANINAKNIPPKSILRACLDCGGSETPQWRRGPDGTVCLCNACGLKFVKRQRRDRDYAKIIQQQREEESKEHKYGPPVSIPIYKPQPPFFSEGPYRMPSAFHPNNNTSSSYGRYGASSSIYGGGERRYYNGSISTNNHVTYTFGNS